MPRFRRTPVAVMALLLLALLAGAVWVVRAQPRPAVDDPVPRRAAPPAVPVVLATARQRDDSAVLEVLGSGLAARELTLRPAATGEVAQVNFRAGQRVQAGQVLLRLDERREKLGVDLAAARLDAAKKLLARVAATRGTGAVPGSVIDEAESAVALADIELRQAREVLADRVLRAPFDGVVGLTTVEPGQRVGPDTTITTLDDRRHLLVAFELPEAWAARLKIGQALTVGNPAFGDRRFEGRIALIDSRVDAVSRNLKLRAKVPNGDDLLRPGMSFQVRLELGGARYVAVPELALQWGREGSYVWAVREGKAVQVAVRSVRRVDAEVLLDGPLQAGEQVVVEGVQRLRPGRAVAPVAGASASAPSAAAAGKAP